MTEQIRQDWFTSSYSGGNNNTCVEVRFPATGAEVRDSKDPDGGHLNFTTVAWAAVRSSQPAAGPSKRGSHGGDAENGPVSWGYSWSPGTRWVCDSAFLARSNFSWQTYPHDARTRQSQHHPEGRGSAP